MAEIRFTVPGVLPGWQRAGKSGKRHFTQGQTAAAEAEVAAWGRQAARGVMLAGPLGMEVTTGRPIPASWSEAKRKRALAGLESPTGKPDWDNCGKLLSDALNGVCYADDAAICYAKVVKLYSASPCTEVRLWELEE